jgi:hypothetical protein
MATKKKGPPVRYKSITTLTLSKVADRKLRELAAIVSENRTAAELSPRFGMAGVVEGLILRAIREGIDWSGVTTVEDIVTARRRRPGDTTVEGIIGAPTKKGRP